MKTFITAAMCTVVALTTLAAIQTRTYTIGQTSCIDVENEYYRLTIVPDLGGRIFKWENKISGIKTVDATVPEDTQKSAPLGGLLDDRGNFYKMKYAVSQVKPDQHTLVLYFRCFDNSRQLGIERKMTFRAG